MVVYIYTADQVRRIGLKILGVDRHRQKRQSAKSNLADFKAHYGVDPIVCAQMWEDLQTTTIAAAQIDAKSSYNRNSGANLKNFLRGFHFLMRYGTELERKVSSGNARNTVRKWTWFFVEKIAALKGLKVSCVRRTSANELRLVDFLSLLLCFICSTCCRSLLLQIVWPQHWSTNFIISVDGVHCKIPEPKHPTLSKDPSFYSHKSNSAGLNYELALSLTEPKLVWLKGPLPAGANPDLGVYQNKHPQLGEAGEALKNKIPTGKKAITDGGYSDRKDPKLSQPNSHDTEELRTFKARARMRQEAFHSRLKRFHCLTDVFRHGIDRHGVCFEAVAVICAYEMELVSPIWSM